MKTFFTNSFKGFLALALFFSIQFNFKAQTGETLNFDGSNDFVTASSINFGTNWTAEVWVNPAAVGGGWYTIMAQDYWYSSFPNGTGFAIAIAGGSVFVNTPLANDAYIVTTIGANVWTHIAATYDNGIFAFYKNGVLIGLDTAGFTNAGTSFVLGSRHDNANPAVFVDRFVGSMDEVRIWNTTRSQCQIQQYMNCEIPGSSSGLVANYHFNQCSAAPGIFGAVLNILSLGTCGNLDDATGNGHTGALQNFALNVFGSSNWVVPGCTAQGITTPASASSSEIDVVGNGNSIPDGSAVTSTTNHTNFNGASTRTFVIFNSGSQVLSVGVPVFTGPGASQFSVSVPPASLVAASTGSTSFQVSFIPTSLGTKNATLNIYSLDCSEPSYNFVITATAVTAAALNFDGVNDYVETNANLAELGKADFTIEAWIKTANTSVVSAGILTCANGNASWEIGEKCFYLNALGRPEFVGYGNNYIRSNVAVNDANWHHVAVVWDYSGSGTTGTGHLYIDGVDQTGVVDYTANNNNIGTFKIGKQNYNVAPVEGPNNFMGDIDEVRVYDRALCLDEILNNKNCEIPSPTTYPDLNGYYRFNQGIAFGQNSASTNYTSVTVFANVANLMNFTNLGPTGNWVFPGAITSGSSCTVYQHREINLKGNGTSIASADATPSLADYTDFGSVGLGSVLSRTFVIENVQTGSLSVTAYSLSGSGASSFTITTNPSASVASSGSTSIVVSFSAATLGAKLATLTIVSDDCDEPVYTFALLATGAPAAAALNFDGSGDAINTTDPVIGLSDFTIEGWIKPNANGGFLVSSRFSEGFQTGFWYTIGFGAGTVGMEMAECGNGPSNYTGITSTTHSITLGTWGHFAVVRSGSNYYMYINGILSQTLTEIASHNFDNVGVNPSHILNIGGWIQNSCCWFNGSMDELRIWKVARTQCEIQSFMNCEIPTSSTNLVSNYHFNQGADGLANPTITRLTDASASAYTGTLNASFALTGTSSNWLAPGGVTSGNTASVAALIEIDVIGNSASIPDGSSSPSTANFTDFNGVSSRTFVIQNTVGGGTLVIATPSIVGVNANQFSITTLPAVSINGIGSTTLVVSFIPTSSGVKNATINISSNDCNESLYDFVITATAVPGAAMHFDGVNDQATVSSGINLNNQSFTIEFWAKRTGTNYNMVVGQGATFSANDALHIGFRTAPGNEFTFAFYGNDMNYTTTAATDGNYHHWACVYDAAASGKNRFLYLDGILVLSDLSPSHFIGTGPFVIGDAGYGSNPYEGYLDELRVWNSARTHCEIQTYMNCEIAGSQPSLTANYHFNQGVAGGINTGLTNLIDDNATPKNATLSGLALNGTLSNFFAPGAVTSGSTTPAPPTASVMVSGNSNSISPGSTSTSTLDFTDFGTASTRTFVVQNTALGTLNIGAPYFTGVNASEFSVSVLPSLSLAASATTSFVIAFTPTTGGFRTATLNINNNDCNVPIFSCAIGGTPTVASALNFDGNSDYIQTPIDADTDMMPNTTWEAWIYPTSTSGYRMIVGIDDGGWDRFLTLNAGQLSIATLNSGEQLLTTITTNQWYHVAVVYKQTSNEAFAYVNGIQFGPYTTAFPSGTTLSNLKIGANTNAGPLINFFEGKIDEVRIWNTARTQCEIQSYMNCEIPGSATGLVANYHFNQGAAGLSNTTHSILIDAAGTNNGTLNTFNLAGATSNWTTPGGVLSGSNTPAVQAATLVLSGNGNNVPVGGVTSTNNFTDFGTNASRTFSISNTSGTLNIGSIYFTGQNAAQFSITSAPANSIAVGNTGFIITLTPTNTGISAATVHIPSNDCTNPTYSFVITASTTPAEALNFDGINDHVLLSDPAFGTSDFTIEAWLKVSSFALNTYFISTRVNEAGANGNYWDFGCLSGTGQVYFETADDGTTPYFSTSSPSSTIALNSWAHAAAVREGNKTSLYINGELKASATMTSATNLFSSNGTMRFSGSGISLALLNGSMDEVRMWSVARTQCQIQSYMNAEIPGATAGLLRSYHFNQGIPSGSNTSVTTLTNAAGAGTGTLNLFTLTGPGSNWISPGTVVPGNTVAVPPTATLTVSGNGNNVPLGTATSTNNFTDFGINSSRTFSITNASGTLNINPIYFTGPNAAQFSVTTSPASSITAGSTGFMITLTPTNTGISTATVNIPSNDCANPTYSFVITASTTAADALNFDGINDYVEIANTSAFDNIITGNFSFEAWVKPTSSGTFQTIISKGNGSGLPGTGEYIFQLSTTNQLAFYHAYANGWKFSSGAVPVNAWSHVAVTFDGVHLKFYINGFLDATITSSVVSATTGNNPVYIGSQGFSCLCNRFQGNIDEVRVWTVPRTQCEIITFMNCEIPGASSGLLANYHFNQGIPSGPNASYSLVTDGTGINTGTMTTLALNGSTSNWVIPGGVTSGSITSALPNASLTISGNGNTIIPGSSVSSFTNFTDFGTTTTRTFVVTNIGSSGTLHIGNGLFTGANASNFSIATIPSTLLAASATSSIVIAFTPTTIGTHTAIFTVYSSDCSAPEYSFVITASATIASALSFDGVDDYIDLGTSSLLKPANALTAEAWVYLSNWVGSSVTFVGNAQFSGYTLRTNGTELRGFVYVNGGFHVAATPLSTITPGWHHVATTFDGRYTNLYLDGVFMNSDDAGATYPVTYVGNNMLLGAEASSGSAPAGGYMNGMLDEVRIWDRALCQAEIQNYMTCEITSTASGLVANYHFNQGIASGVNTVVALSDVSGNVLNGTLTSFSLTGNASNWVTPGAVTSGSSCALFTAAEINLSGNSIAILDGAATPTTSNGTDFGNISLTGNIVSTFTISNTGNSSLAVSSITMSGLNATSFTVGPLSPASPIPQGTFAVFSVTFVPTTAGIKTAAVNISNTDCDEQSFDFVVTGTSTNAAAFSLDGVNDYVTCGSFLTPSYTKEAWIKIGASSNGNNFISNGAGVAGTALWAPGLTTYDLSAGHDGNWTQVQDPTPLTFNTWYHVAVTYDAVSKMMYLYKNGTLVSSSSTTIAPFSGNNPVQVGAYAGTFVTNGAMDEVRIWNRALCQSEIANNMNCEILTTAPGLIANYHFNQGIGYGANATSTMVIDASGSANTGTLVNTAVSGTVSNWQTQGAVTTGSACPIITVPEIGLLGNAVSIIDGSTTSTITNHTDFGGICENTISVRSYTIQNTGTGNLTVSSITIGGTHAAMFAAGALTPASPILPGGTAVFSVTFTPASSGAKTASIAITNNDCNESPFDFVITATANPLPVLTATTTNSVICNGAPTILNGIGADTYTWTGGIPTVTNGVSFTPSLTLTYTVAGTNTLTGCASTNLATQVITVNPTPTIAASSSTNIICDGSNVIITSSNAVTYTLNPVGTAGTSFTVFPSLTTSYSVTGTDANGCVGTNTVVISVTVNALPVVTATASNPVICSTGATSLIGGGADTYTWTGGAINNTAFTPAGTTSYTVTGIYTLTGCSSTNLAVQTITVDVIPSVTATAAASVICDGISATLTASGADTYTWSPGSFTGTVFTPTPSAFTTYTVVGTNSAGCTSTNLAIQSVSVNPLPTVTASISSSVVCSGSTVMLIASGADTFVWSNGVSNSTSFTPATSESYSVVGTSSAGCSSTNAAVVSITVNALPPVTVSNTNTLTCDGESTTLTATGALTYSWSSGETTASIVISPSVQSVYTLTATDGNNCSLISFITQSVSPCTSALSATAVIKNVTCKDKDDGEISILYSSSITDGQVSYLWNPSFLCPGNNCDTIKDLKGGNYSVLIKLTYTAGANFVKTDSVLLSQIIVLDGAVECEIKVYSGITSNEDGDNDVLTIKNIEEFPKNKVSVYNRWGQLVYSVEGYNNKDKAWPSKEENVKLPANTYFYLIDLGNGSKPIKGWVELINR